MTAIYVQEKKKKNTAQIALDLYHGEPLQVLHRTEQICFVAQQQSVNQNTKQNKLRQTEHNVGWQQLPAMGS